MFHFLIPFPFQFQLLSEPVWDIICGGTLRALGIIVSLVVILSFAIPVFCAFYLLIRSGFCADGAVQSPSTLFFCLALGWRAQHCTGDGCYSGWGPVSCLSILIAVGTFTGEICQDALALNQLEGDGMVLGLGVSSLFCGAEAVATALGCCSTRGLFLLGVEGPSSWSLFVGYGIPFNLP